MGELENKINELKKTKEILVESRQENLELIKEINDKINYYKAILNDINMEILLNDHEREELYKQIQIKSGTKATSIVNRFSKHNFEKWHKIDEYERFSRKLTHQKCEYQITINYLNGEKKFLFIKQDKIDREISVIDQILGEIVISGAHEKELLKRRKK